MRSAIFILATSILIGPTACGEESELLRDPWRGFGLGSSSLIRTQIFENGKQIRDELVNRIVAHMDPEGSVRIIKVSEAAGRASTSMSMHVLGGTPEELGMKLTGNKEGAIVIDGESIQVTIQEWSSDPTNKNLEKIARPFPEILKQGELRGASNFSSSLTIFKANNKEVNVPYHEIQTRGLDIAAEPRWVKCVYRESMVDEQGKAQAELLFTEEVKSLKSTLQIKGRTVTCVQMAISATHTNSEPEEKVQMAGTVWLTNAIPGRVAKQTTTETSSDGELRADLQVESFAIDPPRRGIATGDSKLLIPGPDWLNMPVGSWYVRVDQIQDRKTKQILNLEIRRVKAAEILGDDRFVTVTEVLTDQGWRIESRELVLPMPLPRYDAPPTTEEIKLLGEVVKCEKFVKTSIFHQIQTKESVWIPTEEKWKSFLKKHGLPQLKIETAESSDRENEDENISEGAVFAVASTRLGGRQSELATFVVTDPKKRSSPRKILFFSGTAPRSPAATVDISEDSVFFSMVLDFGVPDKPTPDLQTIQNYYRDALSLLRSTRAFN